MKFETETTHLFFPDIIHYMNGRDKVREIVLKACQCQSQEKNIPVTLSSKIFKELNYDIADIISIIIKTGKELYTKFSYSIILKHNDSFTVDDLGNQLWKYMSKTIKNN